MWVKLLLLFFVLSFLLRTDNSFNQDLGRHLKLGEIILQTGQIPKSNLFSYTNPDYPFINTHWLFEVLIYGIDQTINLQWMLIFKVIIFLLSVWLIFKTIPKQNQVLLLPIGFIFLHVLRERLELRPEIFSFLFTAITYYILERFLRGPTKLIYLMPLVQLIWINTHIYFFVGLILQAVFLIHLTYQNLRSHIGSGKLKLLGIILGLSVLVSLVNPNGLTGLLFPFNVTKNYGYTIVENQTMNLLESINFRDPNFLFVKLTVAIILFSITIAILSSLRKQGSNKKIDNMDSRLKNILLSLFGLVLALMHVRSFPYLVFLSLPATLLNFGAIPWNTPTRILTIVAAVLLLFESFFYLNGDYYRFRDDSHKVGLGFEENVRGAMDFVLAHDLPQPIYNNFDIGSYLLYRGYPKYQVFVDGRPEAYPAQFFTGVYIPSQSDYNVHTLQEVNDYKNFKEIEKIYQFKTIIFSHTDQTPWGRNFLQNVVKDEGWKLVYIDDFTIVLVKDEEAKLKGLNGIDLSTLTPQAFNYKNHLSYLRITLFLLSTGYTDSGRQFIGKTLQIFPQSPIANLVIGNPTQNKFFW